MSLKRTKTEKGAEAKQIQRKHKHAKSLLRRTLSSCLTLIVILPGRTSFGVMRPKVIQVALGVEFDLVHGVSLNGGFRLGQQFLELLQNSRAGLPLPVGELDVDDQVQVAASIAALNGHTLTRNLQDLARVENLTGGLGVLDFDSATVKVLDHHPGEARQGLGQRNINCCCQVSSSPPESLMLLFHDVENDISRFLTRHLVGLALEDDLVSFPNTESVITLQTVPHIADSPRPARDVDLQHLLGLGGLLALALLALILVDKVVTRSVTGRAGHHSRRQELTHRAQNLLVT